MSKLRYVLVLAALYGPCSFAADPVSTVEANRKIMYGTAAVRPTPDTFDLASRGMCYVATDTGAITEWTGTAWINAATCGGGAGAVSTSPAYTTIVDSSGDSAVDATANAVKVEIVTPDGTEGSTDADGALVNLGTNNDVTVTSGSVTLTSSVGSPVYVASGGNTCRVFTADGAIGAAGARILYSVFVTNASANDDVLVYDNTSAAGTITFSALNVAAGTTAFPVLGASASNGLYLDLTTGGSMEVFVCYQ